MKLLRFWIFIIYFLILTKVTYAQLLSQHHFEKYNSNESKCGFNSQCLYTKISSPLENLKLPVNAVSNSVLCGRFRFTFLDVINHTGYGFDDPFQGNSYIQCVCDVGNYFQLIFDSPTGDNTPIDILFNESWSQNNPPPNSWILGLGGPIFSDSVFLNNTPGFYGGNAFKHYTTGIDPDTTLADGLITINFNFRYFLCGQPDNCSAFDFTSVVLHELTHVLGWVSSINEDSLGVLKNIFNQNMFTLYDKHFLFYGNITSGVLKQLVDTTTNNFNLLPNGCLRQNKLWFYNDLAHSIINNQNSCLSYVNSNSDITNTISHFGNYQEVFFRKAYLSPGLQPEYIMGESFAIAQRLNYYTPQEIRALRNMGFNFTTNFVAINSNLINNHHPFTIKNMLSDLWYTQAPFPATDMLDNATGFVPADIVISNCDSVIFNLSIDADIIDIDSGDVIRIYPGSLYNIRGCGIGGNNHNCLTVFSTSTGDYIKFKPRPDFIGRAQFGFNLFDEKERGAFMVYTIDVDSCNSNITENIVNGSFEEGMEVCKMDTLRHIENATIHNYKNMYYEGGFGTMLPDGVKYIGWNQVAVKNSFGCDTINGTYGVANVSFGSPGSTLPPAFNNMGERYFVQNQNYSYFRLYAPLKKCSKIKLEFDVCILNNSVAQFEIGFTDLPMPFNQAPNLYNPTIANINGSQGSWYHQTLFINYCDSKLVRYMVVNNLSASTNTTFGIDNLSMTIQNVNCDNCINSAENVDNNNSTAMIANNNNTHELSILYTGHNLITEVNIYDLTGRIIFSNRIGKEPTIINTLGFHQGIYFVRLRNEVINKIESIIIQ